MSKDSIQPEINIGLIGHVDAGKTSLVKALTGTWTDTYSEEIKRGISIRLGYADATFYKCKKCNEYGRSNKCKICKGKTEVSRVVSFVDAPGHETLMTTMLGGAAVMHAAVLVVSANESCPQPQTIEHVMAMKINEIKDIIVVQNKIDLVSKEKAIENQKQISDFLRKFGYEKAVIIPVSANLGINVSELIRAIEENFETPKFDEKKPLKMYCVRSFDVNKPGTSVEDLQGGIMGGTITQGVLKEGDDIEISPGINGRIKTIAGKIMFSENEIKKAKGAGLIAIKTLLDPSITKADKMKGQMIAKVGTLPPETDEIKMRINFLDRTLIHGRKDVSINEKIVLSIGTLAVLGDITEKKKDFVKVKLKSKVIAEKGQKIAISTLENMKWRLTGYGIAE